MKILGYSIWGSDNDSFMNGELWGKNICDCIDYVKNRHLHLNPSFKLTRKTYDISYTYDCYLIVSKKFKDFCLQNRYKGVHFYQIPNYSQKFLLVVDAIAQFDAKRRKTRFLRYRSACNEYQEIVGATPVCLKKKTVLKDGFFRTDLEFGEGYAKSPVILVGPETGEKLKKKKFKGLYLEQILDKYEWEHK
jgi:hypothetical protein